MLSGLAYINVTIYFRLFLFRLDIMRTFITATFAIIFGMAFGQISTPQPSPLGKVEQKVGLTDCSIEYSRPSMKGRTIFGDLVPYGQMWRTGANASTKLSFSDDVKIKGTTIPAGTYALFTIPGQDEWTIIIHKNLSYWGTGGDDYKTDEDLVRFTVKPVKYGATVETLTMNFTNLSATGCDIELVWENTQISFGLEVSYDEKVMKQIEEAMTISPSTYYAAARYYFDNDKDINKALEWVNKALEGGEKYWIMRQKALILAKMGNYKEAIVAAERSNALAIEAKNDGYVKMNNESIEEWKKK